MPTIEKISVALPAEMVAQVHEAVESGDYASSSEVVRDALREWTQKRNLQQAGLKELRRVWKQAIKNDSPGVGPKEVLSRLEKKYRAMSK
ncbi:MAG TPA: type II toxin-antitoxin system ParD family antitoxin [Alloacidobacterium sp.]|nr:type II toxin-antitoxin system ParD family antitoxin [Alloacidobacterium sp.]